MAEIAERYDCVSFTVGTHPHEAASEAAADFAAMRDFAAHPKCVGIGEAGLDYHYNYAPRTSPSASSAARSRSRASSACRSSSIRAKPRTTRRRSSRTRWGGALQRAHALLHLVARARRDGARARAVDLVLGRRHLQEIGGLARHRPRCAARPDPGRDRRALSRARSPSGQAQRAGLRRRHRERRRRGEGLDARGACGRDARQHAASFREAAVGRRTGA